MVRINVSNLNGKRRIDNKGVIRLVRFVLKRHHIPKNSDINIVFVGSDEIKRLNKRFRGKNRQTDVLCFCLFEGMDFIDIRGRFRTDIFISSDTARRNSKRFGNTYKDEIDLYVIHGLLHMIGYRDHDKKRFRAMDKRQRELLRKYKGKE